MSSFERLAEERAAATVNKRIQESIEQEIAKAMEALQQQIEEETQETINQAWRAVHQAAQKIEHLMAVWHSAIETILALRFQAEGLDLMSLVRQMTDPALLEQLVQRLRAGATLDDIRKLLA